MAKIQPAKIFVLLFILITYQILSGEGRHIRSLNVVGIKSGKSVSLASIRKLASLITRSDHIQASSAKISPTRASTSSSHTVDSVQVNKVDSAAQADCPGAKCLDDFRPTAPGKSPGAGHAFVTNTNDVSPNQETNSPNMWNSLAASADDYRRTIPGRSPGAGHAKEDSINPNLRTTEVKKYSPSTFPSPSTLSSASSVVYQSDFRPTAPGSSPGAGHLDDSEGTKDCVGAKCIDDFRPTAPGSSPGAGHLNDSGETNDCVGAKCIDDFRPTDPGSSPGAGHSFVNSSESNMSGQGVAHPKAGQTDDHRSTSPDHSPGAGHARK